MKVAVAVGLVMFLPLGARAQAPPAAANDPGREAVMILRVLNTVQAQMSHPAGAYGSLAQILASPMFKKQFNGASRTDSATAAIGERTLVLVASEDQKHYQAMVTPTDKCGVTMFTNESGLIYSGHALGCDKQP
jgi:hypothetical protein